MKGLTDHTDQQLIDIVYNEAGQIIRDNIQDFSDTKKWQNTVDSMRMSVKVVYCIGILHRQVMNGGCIQYFDNGYGIFAYQTLDYLKNINAKLTYDILKQCLTVINPENYRDDNFVKFIKDRKYNNSETISNELDKLDNLYYELGEKENLEILVANYLRLTLAK